MNCWIMGFDLHKKEEIKCAFATTAFFIAIDLIMKGWKIHATITTGYYYCQLNYACILGGNLNDFHACVIATGLTVMKGVIYAFNCLIREGLLIHQTHIPLTRSSKWESSEREKWLNGQKWMKISIQENLVQSHRV